MLLPASFSSSNGRAMLIEALLDRIDRAAHVLEAQWWVQLSIADFLCQIKDQFSISLVGLAQQLAELPEERGILAGCAQAFASLVAQRSC